MTHKRSATLHDRLDELEKEIKATSGAFNCGVILGFICGVVFGGILTWAIFTYF